MTNTRSVRILCVLIICALVLPLCPVRADTVRYGRITIDKVRFRKTPSTAIGAQWWCLLDEGWVLQILGEEANADSAWYKVCGYIPKEEGKVYTGYIMREYVYEMTASDIILFLEYPAQPNGEKAYIPGDAEIPTVPPEDKTPDGTGAPGAQYGRTTVDKVFFRCSPGSAEYYDLLPKDWTLKIVGSTIYNNVIWYNVEGGTTKEPNGTFVGYIHSSYFAPVSDVPETPTPTPGQSSGYAQITAEGTVLRETASVNGSAITALSYGLIVPVLGESGDMLRVQYGSSAGYVLKSSAHVLTQAEYEALINPATPTPTPEVTGTPVTPDPGQRTVLGYIKLTKEGVNLRAEPAGNTLTPQSSDWLNRGVVLPYYAMPVFKGGYEWILVRYKDMFGYIRSDCYELTGDPSVTPVPTAEPSLTGYVRLIKSGVNIRRTAGGLVIGQLNRGAVLPYFGTDTVDNVRWYYIYSSELNQYGYVMGTMCETVSGPTEVPATPTPTPIITAIPIVTGTPTPTPTPMILDDYVKTTATKVYLRSGPGTASAPLDQIPAKGAVLRLWSTPVTGSGNVIWYPVTYRGQNGYVHGSFSQMLTEYEKEVYKKTGTLPTDAPIVTPTPTAPPIITAPPSAGPIITEAPTEAPAVNGHIVITANKVYVRTGAGTNYAPVDNRKQVNAGEVFAYDRTVENNRVTWYRIQYTPTVTAYIHGNYARVMSDAEYQDWLNGVTTPPVTVTPPPTPTPTPVPTAEPGFVTLRLGSVGSAVTELQQKLYELGYLSKSEISGTYLASTMNAVINFQNAKGLTADGAVDQITWNAIFSGGGQGKTPHWAEGSSVSVELNPVEMVDWFTGDIQTVWPRGATAIITDVYTGISFRARRWAGGNHADAEPLTSADTAAICKIHKVSNAQEISDRYSELQSWRRRPAWVTIGDRTFAGSLYLVPHNYPEGDTIPDNDFSGQFCVHFINSMTHGNANNPPTVDYDKAANAYFGHQSAIKYAYEHSISGTK